MLFHHDNQPLHVAWRESSGRGREQDDSGAAGDFDGESGATKVSSKVSLLEPGLVAVDDWGPSEEPPGVSGGSVVEAVGDASFPLESTFSCSLIMGKGILICAKYKLNIYKSQRISKQACACTGPHVHIEHVYTYTQRHLQAAWGKSIMPVKMQIYVYSFN